MFNATKQGLQEAIEEEKKIYLSTDRKYRFMQWLKKSEQYQIWRFVYALRHCGYYKVLSVQHRSVYNKIMSIYWRRRVNVLGCRLGLIFGPNAFDKGLTIYHIGNIVVDGNIGKHCQLHGDNCIGRSHGNDTPTLGDNVRLGVGAKVIGDIYIADDVTIAAGAVVTKSCYEQGATLAGVPAHIIKHGKADWVEHSESKEE